MSESDTDSDDEWEDEPEENGGESEDDRQQTDTPHKRRATVESWRGSGVFDTDSSDVSHIAFGVVFSPITRGSGDAQDGEESPKHRRATLKSSFEARLFVSSEEASPAAKRTAGKSDRSEKSKAQTDTNVFSEEQEENRGAKAETEVPTQKKLHQAIKVKFEASMNINGQGEEEKQSDRPGFKYKREKKGKGINTQYEHNIGIPGPITAAKSIAKGVSKGFSKIKSTFNGPGARRSAHREAGSKGEHGGDIEMKPLKSSESKSPKAKK